MLECHPLAKFLVWVAAGLLIISVFTPLVCVFTMVGVGVVGGCVSLWGLAPWFGLLLIGIVVCAVGVSMVRQYEDPPGRLLTVGLFFALVTLVGLGALLLQWILIHPYCLALVGSAACVLIGAAFAARQKGEAVRPRFHLRTLLTCTTLSCLSLGIIRRLLDA